MTDLSPDKTQSTKQPVESFPALDAYALLGGKSSGAAKTQPAEHQSVLEKGIDCVTSLFIHDDKIRKSVDHYGAEFAKTASLFAGGKIGLAGTLLTYGLDQAQMGTPLGQQVEDGLMGAAKGGVMKGAFSMIGDFKYAPSKGVFMGVTSRTADAVFQGDTLSNPSNTLQRLHQEFVNPQALLFDAAVWTAGEGLFGVAGRMSSTVKSNPLIGGMVMGGSFGMVNGGANEIMREKAAGQNIDWGKVLIEGGKEAGLNAAAAGAGLRMSGVRGDSMANPADTKAPNESREFIITSGKDALQEFRYRSSEDALLTVREKIAEARGKAQYGPEKKLFVQRLGGAEKETSLNPAALQADLIASCYPENLSAEARAKHIFPQGEGKVWLATGKGDKLLLSSGDRPIPSISEWKKQGYTVPMRLDGGNTTINVMAPLTVGDPAKMDAPESKAAWDEFDRQLGEMKKIGVDGVSTDVWWGLIEPTEGQFHWNYYDKLSEHITRAGLKWVPILSFHQCGGNVGDTVNVPLPSWIWNSLAAKTGSSPDAFKFKSEQGNTSNEYISFWATKTALDHYASVMKAFEQHYAGQAGSIGEVNISLGPSGELRYPAYNQHDQNVGYPSRGALQSYSDMAKESFREYVLKKYGDVNGVAKAWGIEHLDSEHILPPSNPNEFFGRGDHFDRQYGKDFFDWYNQSLLDHGKTLMGTALGVFGARDSAFYGIDLGAKIPGVHWRIGERQGDKVVLSDRLAELTAGLIRTSGGDWDTDALGRGYRPILSMFKDLQPLISGKGTRVVPSFTAMEMPDGQDGPSAHALPHTLATWVGQESERQGLWLKGENALAGDLSDGRDWILIDGLLDRPSRAGLFHGVTLLRMSDIVDNDLARAKLSELIHAINSVQPDKLKAA